MLQIPENIRQARVSSGKTQKEMAHLLGVKRTTYANWEENTEPAIATIKDIAKILGIEFYSLIEEAPPPIGFLQPFTAEELRKLTIDQSETIKSQQRTIESLILEKYQPDKNDGRKNA